MKLLDPRFQGMAVGVGTSKIIGKIHAAQLKILNKVLFSQFKQIDFF